MSAPGESAITPLARQRRSTAAPAIRLLFAAAAAVVVITAPPAAYAQSPCRGDCDGDHFVSGDEVLRGIQAALAGVHLEDCDAFDLDTSGGVTVEEIVAAVADHIGPCRPPPTPTPSPSPTPLEACREVTPALYPGPTTGCKAAFPEQGNILWFEDEGDLTVCCHRQMGVERLYYAKDRLAAHIDATCPHASFDFAFVFTSGHPSRVVGSASGGGPVFLPICHTEESGIAPMPVG